MPPSTREDKLLAQFLLFLVAAMILAPWYLGILAILIFVVVGLHLTKETL